MCPLMMNLLINTDDKSKPDARQIKKQSNKQNYNF